MTDIINLNKARKAKIKQGQKKQAAENRVIYGVSTKTRKSIAKRTEAEVAKLEAHRLDTFEKQQKPVD